MNDCKLPRVVRARGLYIYDECSRRYLDFHLDGGRLVLGHRIPHQLKLIKSVLARGLYACYPSVYPLRLKKAFLAFFGTNIIIHGFRDPYLARNFLKENYNCTHFPYSWQEEAQELARASWTLGAPIDDLSVQLWEFAPPLPPFLGYLRFFVQRTHKVQDKAELKLWGDVWDPFTLSLCTQMLYSLIRERALTFYTPSSGVGQTLWVRKQAQAWLPCYDKTLHFKVWQTFKEKGIILPICYEQPLFISKKLQKQDWKLFEKAQEAYWEKT